MVARRIIGVVIIILGVVLLACSFYIKDQIGEGKQQISSSEKQVEQGNRLFSLNPVTKEIGKEVSGSANKKIAAGKEEIAHYEQMAQWLKVGGIVGIILGIAVFFLGRRK